MEKKYTLTNLFFALLKRIWIIIIVAVIGATAGYSYATFYVAPSYSSSATFIMTNSSSGISNDSSEKDPFEISTTQQTAAGQLINTYEQILTSSEACERIANSIIGKTNYSTSDSDGNAVSYSASQIKGMVSISKVGSSQVMRLTIVCGDAEDACTIANEYYSLSADFVHEKFKAGDLARLDPATVKYSRIAPSKMLYTLIAALICAALAIIIIIIITLSDKRIKNAEDIAGLCNIPVIGTIPHTEH